MVRFGILGAGNIAHRFAASLAHEEGAQLVALSARNAHKARTFAEQFGVDARRAYTSHDQLLADPEVDAIYLALPHVLHHEWALAALRADKAVLCEKPAFLSAAQAEEVAQVAQETGVLFMEAMKCRFVPAYEQVIAAVGELGPVRRVETSLCNDMLSYVSESGTYHLGSGPGSGALLDTGTYCASWIEVLLPGEPRLAHIYGQAWRDADIYTDAELAVGEASARLECAFDRARPRRAAIVCEGGEVVVDELHRPTHATVRYADGRTRAIDAPYVHDDFFGEVEHFVGLLEQGAAESPVMPLAATVRCARILDAVCMGYVVTPACLETIEEQERLLRYPERFGAAEALELGQEVVRLLPDYDRGVCLRIVREADEYDLFRYGSDDKRPANYAYAEGKRLAALASGHASVWPWAANQIDGSYAGLCSAETPELPCGGAFPIRVGGEWVATLCLSGLHEGKDHELIVRALASVLGVQVPELPCVCA